MSLKLELPESQLSLKPKISIFGVGGAGGNALNNMIRSNLEGVQFIAANTDAQSLEQAQTPHTLQLGSNVSAGLGAGSHPESGRAAAEETIAEIERFLEGNHMIFITAGMGGGTGTGAAPVIAQMAREKGILTVAVVTKPFDFEGKYRMETAQQGIEELKQYVDTLIIIPNQNLFRVSNENTTFEAAFELADDVLHAGVRGVTDLITMPGLINLDFADIKTVMTKMGKAMMGTGEAEGDDRALRAAEEAISNPLLDDISIKGAKGVLINITGGADMTLFEVDAAAKRIGGEVDPNANIIFGSAFNQEMEGKIRISVVATGIEDNAINKISNDFAKESVAKNNSISFSTPNIGAVSDNQETQSANLNSFAVVGSGQIQENENLQAQEPQKHEAQGQTTNSIANWAQEMATQENNNIAAQPAQEEVKIQQDAVNIAKQADLQQESLQQDAELPLEDSANEAQIQNGADEVKVSDDTQNAQKNNGGLFGMFSNAMKRNNKKNTQEAPSKPVQQNNEAEILQAKIQNPIQNVAKGGVRITTSDDIVDNAQHNAVSSDLDTPALFRRTQK